jgi:exo-1,4-beta-D-glucosaminidase
MSKSKLRLLALAAVAALAAVGSADPARADGGGASALTSGWKVQSSAIATDPGSVISDPAYEASGWLPISQPETLMAALVENGRYPNIFFSDNLAQVDTAQFDVNWWYRDELEIHQRPGQPTFLTMNGVASRANLWVNGTKIADQSRLQGSYSRLEFDITPYVRDGDNAIALDVYKNDTGDDGYLTLDMVDWNPKSPDNWTGLQ